jgi:1-acyl-sn-glycerol-3-phosphate acyltransferase
VGAAGALGWSVLSLLLTLALPVLLLVFLFDRRRDHRLLGAFGSCCLRLFFVHFLGAIRYHRVAERPAPGRVRELGACVFAANHRSWLDGLLALALFPGARVPVKASYLRIPVLGRVIRWMGCIPLDRSSAAGILEGLRASREALAHGHSLFVFPEGTRKPGPGVGAFSDVFFRLAAELQAPVVPVVLHSDTPTLSPGAPVFLPWRRACFRVRLLAPHATDPRDRPADLARRVRSDLARTLEVLDAASGIGETDAAGGGHEEEAHGQG